MTNRFEYAEERKSGYGIVNYGGSYQIYKNSIPTVSTSTEKEAHDWIQEDLGERRNDL